jgi:hypothetical protein
MTLRFKMKIVIPISKKYLRLIPAHIYLFKKYWENHPDIIFLTYKDVSRKLDEKIYLYNVSDEDIVASSWTHMILNYLENTYDENNILLFLDDILLLRKVNIEKINKCIELIDNKIAEKIYLIGSLTNTPGCYHDGQDLNDLLGMVKITDNSMWRNSLQPCIWNVETFKSELKKFNNSVDPWVFEESNLDKNSNIYSFKHDYPMAVSHVYRRGNLLPNWYSAIEGCDDGSKLDEMDISFVKNFL